jgi:hypothetical protein
MLCRGLSPLSETSAEFDYCAHMTEELDCPLSGSSAEETVLCGMVLFNVLPQSVTHTAIGHGFKFQNERTEGILASTTHFQTLLLPLPRINILGDAEWDVTEAVIKKSYRDLCVKIHPDKCRFERSAEVFNAVRFEATHIWRAQPASFCDAHMLERRTRILYYRI